LPEGKNQKFSQKKEKEKKTMAQNWTLAEATKEVLAGNKEAILDIGKRFPLTATAIAAMGNNEGALQIINALPDHVTARKIEMALKGDVEEKEEAETEDGAEDEAPKKKTADEKKAARAAARKAKREAAKKAKEAEADAEEDDEAEETEEQDYSEMTAVELYKLCKKRKLDVEARQKASVYVKALKAADAAAAKETEAEDEDWEDEEEEAPAPKATPKKDKKKPAAKPAKKEVEEEEDEDDDWDI
jgi:hypothetical protein